MSGYGTQNCESLRSDLDSVLAEHFGRIAVHALRLDTSLDTVKVECFGGLPLRYRAPMAHVPQTEPFRWVGVDEHAYKETDGTFKDVTRRVLCRDDHQGTETRYFEVGAGGHTTLEKHEHTHVVVPIRGSGRALIGDRVVTLTAHDVVFVPPWAWHQFQAADDEPLGFLCTVRIERDRPTLPSIEELAQLRAIENIGHFIKARA